MALRVFGEVYTRAANRSFSSPANPDPSTTENSGYPYSSEDRTPAAEDRTPAAPSFSDILIVGPNEKQNTSLPSRPSSPAKEDRTNSAPPLPPTSRNGEPTTPAPAPSSLDANEESRTSPTSSARIEDRQVESALAPLHPPSPAKEEWADSTLPPIPADQDGEQTVLAPAPSSPLHLLSNLEHTGSSIPSPEPSQVTPENDTCHPEVEGCRGVEDGGVAEEDEDAAVNITPSGNFYPSFRANKKKITSVLAPLPLSFPPNVDVVVIPDPPDASTAVNIMPGEFQAESSTVAGMYKGGPDGKDELQPRHETRSIW